MPPTRPAGGWHLPGYNYCGPFTNLRSRNKPVNAIDECCKKHDENYSNSDVTTRKADDELLGCIDKAGGHKLISGIFNAKRVFDEATGYASDKIFRAGDSKHMGSNDGESCSSGSRKRGIAEKRRIDQYYRQKKVRQAPAEEPSEETENAEMQGEQEPVDTMSAGADGGGGGGGGGNAVAENEIPWGLRPKRWFAKYKKSYQIYITNGMSETNYGWAQRQVPAFQPWNGSGISWCEGWQIIPWGGYRAAMSCMEWNLLNLSARRWKPVECSVMLDDIIPFQETVNSAGVNFTNVTFTNKPNLHVYCDDSHQLPCRIFTQEDVEHNDGFSIPFGDMTSCKLKCPKWVLCNVLTDKWGMKRSALPPEDKPQKLFSLYNTGKVTALHPGEKLMKKHTIMQSGWYGARGSMDYRHDIGHPANESLDDYQIAEGWVNQNTMAECGGTINDINNETDTNIQTVFRTSRNTVQLGLEESHTKQNWWHEDSQNSMPWKGVPYLLIRSEPYAQPTGGYMMIYHQAHVHYEVVIEVEGAENCGYGNNYDPTAYGLMTPQNTVIGCNSCIARTCMVGPCDNSVGRISAPQEERYHAV